MRKQTTQLPIQPSLIKNKLETSPNQKHRSTLKHHTSPN